MIELSGNLNAHRGAIPQSSSSANSDADRDCRIGGDLACVSLDRPESAFETAAIGWIFFDALASAIVLEAPLGVRALIRTI